MKKRIAGILCLAFILAMGAALAEADALVGQTMPDFTVTATKGGKIGYYQLGAFATEAQFRGIVEHFLDGNYDGTPAACFNVYVGCRVPIHRIVTSAVSPLAKPTIPLGLSPCDQYMEPVPGVVLKFCDTDCRLYTSDADGIIAFTDRPARYTVQIESVPEGYSYDASFEAVCDGSGEWVIVEIVKE